MKHEAAECLFLSLSHFANVCKRCYEQSGHVIGLRAPPGPPWPPQLRSARCSLLIEEDGMGGLESS